MKLVHQVTADFLRRHFVTLAETHNPGGVHGKYRTLRAFFRWVTEAELMPPDWKNPLLKAKPPRTTIEPLEPIPLEDARALLDTCAAGTSVDDRDRVILHVLFDTGADQIPDPLRPANKQHTGAEFGGLHSGLAHPSDP